MGTDSLAEQYRRATEWPLTVASVLFLVVYAWPILQPTMADGIRQACARRTGYRTTPAEREHHQAEAQLRSQLTTLLNEVQALRAHLDNLPQSGPTENPSNESTASTETRG